MMPIFGGAQRDGEQARIAALEGMVAAISRSQAIIEFELDGTIITANENFLRTMGYSLAEIQGRRHSMFAGPEYAAGREYQEFWQALNGGQFMAGKFQRLGKNGREVWIQGAYNPIFDKLGKPYKVIKFAVDITDVEQERVRNEAERREVEAQQNTTVSALAASLGRLAQGDLTTRIEAAFSGRYEQIKQDFNQAVESLGAAIGSISASTGALRNGSDEIASASDDLSRRTEQQAASLEETAAALDQITAAVRRSAEGAAEASKAASSATSEAATSSKVMGEAVAAMGEIRNSSEKITQIIGVIDEIAFQTNLLALNAGVEAARAGDAGRGFAVVAQEVRALAQRSAQAAREIKDLIANSSKQVQRGVELVGDTGRALDGIVTKVAAIDSLIGEIARSSQEQSTGLSQVNSSVNQMDQVTQQNAAMVEEATAAAANLKAEAGELTGLVNRFQTADAGYAPPARRGAAPAARPVTAPRRAPARAASGGAAAHAADDWEEF